MTYPSAGRGRVTRWSGRRCAHEQQLGLDRPHLIKLISHSYATVAHTEHEREWLIERGGPPEKLS